jgi:hypothetical protein
MKLFHNESVLGSVAYDTIVLTTHRIRQGDDHSFTSIMLEEVCSVEVSRMVFTRLCVYGLISVAVAAALWFWSARTNSTDPQSAAQVSLAACGESRLPV